MNDRPDKDPPIVRFARLVRSMRQMQTRYFTGEKTHEVMILAKNLEQRVDVAAAYILDRVDGPRDRQPTLFDPGPPKPTEGAYGPPPPREPGDDTED